MKIKTVAIDDEPLALEIIKDYAKKIPHIELTTFGNAVDGLEYLTANNTIDLLLIDISMPDINGIDLVNQLQLRPMIIFTTAYKEFALQGFELDAVDYLLKPFSFERFEKAVQKAQHLWELQRSIQPQEEYNLFVFSDYRMIKIPANEIIYIESLDDYIKIHLRDGKSIMTLMPLKKVVQILPDKDFARIHRSYIVSLKNILSISARRLVLKTGQELPVSESHIEALNKKLHIH